MPPVTATESGPNSVPAQPRPGRRGVALGVARALMRGVDGVCLDACVSRHRLHFGLGRRLRLRLGGRNVRRRIGDRRLGKRLVRGLFGGRLVHALFDRRLGKRLVRSLFARALLHRLSILGEDLVGEVDLRRGRGLERLTVGSRLHVLAVFHALERQRQAAPLGVDLDDLHVHDIALRDDLARVLDVVLRELGDVNEALDARHDLDEGAERHDLRHLALRRRRSRCRRRRPAARDPTGSA